MIRAEDPVKLFRGGRSVSAPSRLQGGLTLIELAIVMVFVAILGSTAMGMYSDFSRGARRDDAMRVLSEVATRLEIYRLGHGAYTQALGTGGLGLTATSAGDGRYLVSVKAPTANCPIGTCYVLQATAQAEQRADTCGETLEYGSNGLRVPADCWP